MKQRIIAFFCLFFLIGLTSVWAQKASETVYLKNGSVIKGFISEWVPNKTIKLITSDESVLVISISDIDKVIREPATVVNQEVAVVPVQTHVQQGQVAQEAQNVKHQANAQVQADPVQPVGPVDKANLPKVSRIPEYRKPGSALVWSIVIPGGGQIYNKQTGKGLLFMGSNVIGIAGMVVGIAVYEEAVWISGLGLYGASWLLSLIDAPISARKINEAYHLGFEIPGIKRPHSVKISPTLIAHPGPKTVSFQPGVGVSFRF